MLENNKQQIEVFNHGLLQYSKGSIGVAWRWAHLFKLEKDWCTSD
jgi:hypothetical protein